MNIEPLESRIAPSTLIALDNSNNLLRFNSSNPSSITATTPVTGLGGEILLGIDFRPADGKLYGVSDAGKLYTINPVSGGATLVAALSADAADMSSPFGALSGTSFGLDFNPQADRLRVVSDTGQNLRINPADGKVTTDADLNPGTPTVGGGAYDNNFPGTTTTTLYDIDGAADNLVTQNPPNSGTLTPVGSGLGVDVDAVVGFDIGFGEKEAFLAATVGGTTRLYSIDLTAGTATQVGTTLGTGATAIRGLTVLMNVWDGVGNDTASVWVSNLAPASGDSLLFPAGPTNKSADLGFLTSINTIRVTASGYSLENDTGSIRIDGGLHANFASGTFETSFVSDFRFGSLAGGTPVIEAGGANVTITLDQLRFAGSAGVDFTGPGKVVVNNVNISSGTGEITLEGPQVTFNDLVPLRTTRVQSGSLTLNGDPFGLAAPVIVEGGAFSGSGRTGDVTATGGTLISGDVSLSTADLSLSVASTARFEFPAGNAGFEPLDVFGTVDLGGATLQTAVLGSLAPGRVVLISNDDADPITGTFAGLADGATVMVGGSPYTISYAGGDGNDVVLTRTGLAPAITGGKVATFTDVDGDLVTVKISKGTLADSNFVLRDVGGGRAQLEDLILNGVGFAGAAVTITAKRQGNAGDNSVNVGYIVSDQDLAGVSVAGDLGSVDAGDATPTTSGLKSLAVQSLGAFGLGTGGQDLLTNIRGALDKATVRGNVVGASLNAASVGAITIGGSLIGGDDDNSGQLQWFNGLGSITINGSILGGAGDFSGYILAPFKSLTVGGSVIGGTGDTSASISAINLDGPSCGTLKIAGDLVSVGLGSGSIYSFQDRIETIFIGGSMIGNNAIRAGGISIAGSKSITIRGDVTDNSSIYFSKPESNGPALVGSLFIGGNLAGARIFTQLDPLLPGGFAAQYGSLTIGGSILQAPGAIFSQAIIAATIGKLTIGGSVFGDQVDIDVGGAIGKVVIGGDLLDAALEAESMPSVTILGSVVGGSIHGAGGSLHDDHGSLGDVKIGFDLRRPIGSGGGDVSANGNFKSLTVGGSIVNGLVAAAGDLGAVTVNGSIRDSLVTAGALSSPVKGADLVLKSLTVKGNVEHSRILGGYDLFDAVNGDAQIGAVSVGGDWIASDLISGVQDDNDPGIDDGFGDGDDQAVSVGDPAIFSRIASITIKGQLLGTPGGSDQFGFVAQQIDKLTIGSISYPLTASHGNDHLLILGATSDFALDEVA